MEQIEYDILILGAGPAGLCAALRLSLLGYRTALREAHLFPREQIGESLSPGIYPIFDYLGVSHLLEEASYRRGLSSRVLWSREVETAKDGFIVDRAKLDAALLGEVVRRGVDVSFGWEAPLPGAKLVVDARGRSGVRAVDRVAVAPTSVAMWAHVPESFFPYETRVEAMPGGWLWGAPVAGGLYRVMAFVDPLSVKGSRPEAVLGGLAGDSKLFIAARDRLKCVRTCTVFNYAHRRPWEGHHVKVGEAAFTIDPLSSTGVEKAMRNALQAVIAINTVFREGDPELAQLFYEDKIRRTLAEHWGWTRDFYRGAWPGEAYSFWRDRSVDFTVQAEGTFLEHWAGKDAEAPMLREVNVGQLFNEIWNWPAHVSPLTGFEGAFCVVDDVVRLHTGIRHPRLKGQLVYLGGVEIKPLLDMVPASGTFGELLYRWSSMMPMEQAAKMIAFLWEREVLC